MLESLDAIYQFLTNGIYTLIVEAYAWIIIKVVYIKYYLLLQSIEFSFDIAQQIISQLNITDEIQAALNKLPSSTVNQLNFFNVIEAINILLNAAVTRFVMNFRS